MPGRIRTIKPEILEDDDTGLLSHAAFRMFIGMITLSDDYGNLRGNLRYLQGQIFWGCEADIDQAISELEAAQLVTRYRVDGKELINIRNWTKHQKVDKKGSPRVPGPQSEGAEILHFVDSSRKPREHSSTPRDKNPTYPTTTNDPTNDLDHSSSPLSESRPPKKKLPPEALELAQTLACLIAERQPGSRPAREPDKCAQTWAKDLDRLHRLDKRPWTRIREVLEWSQRDQFWQNNILSGSKLREKFDQLEAQMGQPGRASPATNRRPGSLSAREIAQMALEEQAREESAGS